jgi:hypothetical protein
MKLTDCITRVRNISGDTTSLQFTDSQVTDWVNDGIRECAVQNNLLQKRATQNSVVGQSDYALPADILKLHSIKYDDVKLPVITLEEFDEQYSGVGASTTVQRGTPSVCYIWAGLLVLFPAPNVVKALVTDYTYRATDLASPADANTELPLPVGYHSRIVDYCLAQVYLQDDNNTMYQVKMQEFQTGVQNLKDQPENTYDLYPSISVDSRDMGNGWDINGDFF